MQKRQEFQGRKTIFLQKSSFSLFPASFFGTFNEIPPKKKKPHSCFSCIHIWIYFTLETVAGRKMAGKEGKFEAKTAKYEKSKAKTAKIHR